MSFVHLKKFSEFDDVILNENFLWDIWSYIKTKFNNLNDIKIDGLMFKLNNFLSVNPQMVKTLQYEFSKLTVVQRMELTDACESKLPIVHRVDLIPTDLKIATDNLLNSVSTNTTELVKESFFGSLAKIVSKFLGLAFYFLGVISVTLWILTQFFSSLVSVSLIALSPSFLITAVIFIMIGWGFSTMKNPD